jgi:hypothetical protein
MLRGRLLLIAGAFLIAALQPAGRAQQPPPEQPPPFPRKVILLVAKVNIDYGAVIKNPYDLFVEKIFLEEDAPRDGLLDYEKLRGKTVKRGLRKGDHVSRVDLVEEQPIPAQGKPRLLARWEYCEFSWVGEKYRVEMGELVHEARSIAELSQKLGRPTQTNNSTAILNILGADGWELVSHQHLYEGTTKRHFWTFKRPLPPAKNP